MALRPDPEVGYRRPGDHRLADGRVERRVFVQASPRIVWATLHDPDDGTITLPGCLLLQFAADGRCFDLREYWNVQDGTVAPYEGWGSWPRG